jgi:HNH endonuclease
VGKRKYTDEQLNLAVARSRNMRELLTVLGLVPRGGNYETVRYRMAALGIDASGLRREFTRGRVLSTCTEVEIAEAIATSRSMAQVLAKLGVRPGGNQDRLKNRIEELGLNTSHFLGAAWSRGLSVPAKRQPIETWLVEGKLVSSDRLRRRLIERGIKEARCEACGGQSWRGAPMPLELDHINGRRDDNRLTNLRLLCPNCHAQTPTYRGRNVGRLEAVF